MEYSFFERLRIAKTFLDLEFCPADDLSTRLIFIEDLVMLCTREERYLWTPPRKIRVQSHIITSDNDDSTPEPLIQEESPDLKPDNKPLSPKDLSRYQYLIYMGRTRLSFNRRFKEYASKFVLMRHFHRNYKQFDRDSFCPFPGPLCATIVFTKETDFLNHAARVHRIPMDEKTWSNPEK